MALVRAWKLKLQPASFRGIVFEVASASDEFGRATVTHKFPQSTSDPYVEDLGDAGRAIEIKGFLYGSNYMARRDALEAAFRQEGPGELVHPWYGRLTVSLAAPVKGVQSSSDGGYYEFTAKFVKQESAKGGLTGSASLFDRVLSSVSDVVGTATLVVDAVHVAKSTAWTVVQTTRSVWRFVNGVLSILNVDATVTPFARAVMALGGSASEVSDPSLITSLISSGDLGSSMAQLVEAAAGAISGKATVSGTTTDPGRLISLANAAPALSGVTSLGASRAQAVEAANAISIAWRLLAVANACREAAGMTPESSDEASVLMDSIMDAIDDAMLIADDDSCAALQDMREATVRALAANAGESPGVVQTTPSAVIPSLALVFSVNGTLVSEEDMIVRNAISHPGFIAGGAPVELANA